MSKKIMKRSLALGALMAFVITGSAFAADQHKELNNEKDVTVATDTGHSKPRVEGGNYITTGETPSVVESRYVVSGGNWNMIIGGHYVQNISTADTNVNVISTNVTITGGEARQVIGGSAGTDNKKLVHTWSGSSNLTIVNGKFGAETTTSGDNSPELLVVGGDLIKDNGESSPVAIGTSTIENVNTTIKGGEFNSAIIGGSAAIQYYGGSGTTITTNVGTATTNISGGEFNHAIAAGGLAYGYNSTANVKTAVLNISGDDTEINCDIFAGGLAGSLGAGTGVVASNTVEGAEVNIENVNAKSIYGTGGVINWASNKWNYSQNTSSSAIVDTTLKLTNVTADNVDIPLGSVTLRVEDTVDDTGNQIVIGNETDGTKFTVGDNVTVSV